MNTNDKMAEAEILAMCLDEWGHPQAAASVRKGEDLGGYEEDLKLIRQLRRFGVNFSAAPAPAVGDELLPDGYIDRISAQLKAAPVIPESDCEDITLEPTPAATQGEVTLCFPGLGRAGPFKFEDGKLTLPAPTMNDLAYYFRQGYVLATQGDARQWTNHAIGTCMGEWNRALQSGKLPSEAWRIALNAAIAAQAGGE